MTEIFVRRAVLSDGPLLPAVFETAIRKIASRFYNPDQVKAWAARSHRLQHVFETDFNARAAWVAEGEDGEIKAYIDLEGGGHIDFFYALPEVSRTTVTAEMYELLEAEARGQNVKTLSTEASEAAKRFFEKRGFFIVARQDVIINDISIHNYRMRKDLTTIDFPRDT